MRKISSRQFRDKKILYRDKETYKSFYNVGFLTKQDILKLGMSENKFKELQRINYVEKHIISNRATGQQEEYYKLSNAGRDFFSEKLNITKDYYSSKSPEHDIFLSKAYMRLKDEVNFKADNWRNESECRDMYKEYMRDQHISVREQERNVSPVDGMLILDNGEQMAIEITTNRYGEADIQAKRDFATTINAEIQLIKAY